MKQVRSIRGKAGIPSGNVLLRVYYLFIYPQSRFTDWLLQEAENKILSDITH